MIKNPALRIILDVIMFGSVLLGWWFIAIPVGIVGAWFFSSYVEIVIAGFIYDILFSLNADGHMGIFNYAYLISSVIILGIISYLKNVVKNHT
ncbi:MAG TPA: hypothetical protein VF438_03330 [Candidatus Paceibacterota bacterium]